ncbi:hypothetical protein OG978_22860 [Streptomyces sp. NBC_01591]|uniref:hypothetical protein n=1 Tax=Streptomyces sp. NBC_01591 TaxID=2975888 RepID=UPI002DD8EB58|nr:hypothetical protein [Streptomyces sp. NBC_01591]WSD69965.1 hypothetical protein OG978_22860 [Streptomyces sp. NBC_01591]
MITTNPVGGWSWETKEDKPGQDLALRCGRTVLKVWATMHALGIVNGDATADISTRAEDDHAVLFTRKQIHATLADAADDSGLFAVLRSTDLERVGVVEVNLTTPGTCMRNGKAHRVEKLFVISAEEWASGAGTVTLDTYSDAWMSHDLRGHRQPEIQKENAPRLKAALTAITRMVGVEVVASDFTSYGIPTKDGFEDLPDEDPDILDSWYMAEVPRRTGWLQSFLPPNSPRFAAETDAPVSFVEVARGGRTVGYLWAAEDGVAAGFEPRTPAGDEALDAGQDWLMRLSEAKQRGLTPAQALHELASWPGSTRSGTVVPGTQQEASSLEDLQDLSGRE